MPIVGIELSAIRTIESKFDPDRGTPEASKFEIGTLDARVHGRIMDKAMTMNMDPTNPGGEQATSINAQEMFFQTAQYGLRGWRNVMNSKGQPLLFKTVKSRLGGVNYDIVDPEILKQIPQAVIQEIAEEIIKDNNLSETEGKNSDAPSSL